MNRFLLALALAATLFAQTLVTSIADITGDASTHAVATTPGSPVWVQFVAPSTNSAVVRIGDSGVTCSTEGTPIAAGAGFMMPPNAGGSPRYDLTKIYYCAGSGDKLTVTYAH